MEKKKEFWAISDEEFSLLSENLFNMAFQPEGILTHGLQKLILILLATDITQYAMTRYEDPEVDSFCIPEYYKNREVIYKYADFAKACRWKTVKTLKKYLQSLVEIGILAPFEHPIDGSRFFAKVDWKLILNSPKIPDEEENT